MNREKIEEKNPINKWIINHSLAPENGKRFTQRHVDPFV